MTHIIDRLVEAIVIDDTTVMETITGAIQLLPKNDRTAYHKYSDAQLSAALAKYIRMKKANRDHFETVQKLPD